MNAEKKCKKCGKCCKGKILGPIIFPEDIEGICQAINVTPDVFLSLYCDSQILNTNHEEVLIYFLKVVNDACIFLKENNLCQIFENRPYQCVYAPFQFLGYYKFWEHMECVNEEDFAGVDTSENDMKMLRQLLDNGYKGYRKEGD